MTSPSAPVIPSLYTCEVTHVRGQPVRHALRRRTYLWLVDIDARVAYEAGLEGRRTGRDRRSRCRRRLSPPPGCSDS
ncbi:DUF1365 family protein [Streptomyces sp. NPDC059835]|uniref:DUF1365 family protein n=1 Tax=Streptomyces sp. NPDC059835 TaxID=3346967 RepID=UPI00365467FC